MLKSKVEGMLKAINELLSNMPEDSKLPGNTFYLNEDEIVCGERDIGVSRYPYDSDGLVVFAQSSGNIEGYESMFRLFKPEFNGDDAGISFFAGIKQDNGEYFPISILGVNRQLFESADVKRYTVFSLRYAWYITETANATFAVRLHLDKQKHIFFSVIAINKSETPLEFYLASYFEPVLSYEDFEDWYGRLARYGYRYDNGNYILKRRRYENTDLDFDCLGVAVNVYGNIIKRHFSTAKNTFLGQAGRYVTNAIALKKGAFTKEIPCTNTTSLPIACDIIHFTTDPRQAAGIDYELIIKHGDMKLEELNSLATSADKRENDLAAWQAEEKAEFNLTKITFDNWNLPPSPKGEAALCHTENITANSVNRFIRNVQKQINYCALGKNSTGQWLGIRDVYQQLESSLLWQPEKSRKQMVLCMNYLLSNGRAPRQITFSTDENTIPPLDLRNFIDQGVWIVSTFYTYLCYTDDFSILDEICDYLDMGSDGKVQKSKRRDSILQHLICIMDYLISNIDTEYQTNCLRVLFGDWNDALDGMGKTSDTDKEYGSGVSVMATLQLYQNLHEMTAILKHIGGYESNITKYQDTALKIEEGLLKHAVDKDGSKRRIIHGWGDKLSYKVGSFKDPDGDSRISITANAFWAITGMIKKDTSLKNDIFRDMMELESDYGLKTFNKPFPLSALSYVGRICKLTPGTYENSAVYAHASIFGVLGLFCLGQSKEAWKYMVKTMVISHKNATMTTFVMPNSYCENEEYSMYGNSMGDWYTGSATALVKGIIKYGFGIIPTLDGLIIQTPKHMPSQKAEIQLKIKSCDVTLRYSNENNANRKIMVNGQESKGTYDTLLDTFTLFIERSKFFSKLTVDIID